MKKGDITWFSLDDKGKSVGPGSFLPRNGDELVASGEYGVCGLSGCGLDFTKREDSGKGKDSLLPSWMVKVLKLSQGDFEGSPEVSIGQSLAVPLRRAVKSTQTWLFGEDVKLDRKQETLRV